MRRAALASLTALLLAAAAVAGQDASPAGEMRQVFRLSGLEAQLGSLDAVVGASLAPNLERVPAAQAAVVKQAVLAEWSGPALQQRVAGRLEKVHNPEHAAATLNWLRSPLGRRITLLETQTSTAEGVRAMESFAHGLESQPPPAARVALAREIDRATGATEFAVELSLASARAAMSAVGAALPAERRLDPVKIEKAIAAQRANLHKQLAQVSLVSTLFSYRSLSDAELESYLAFVRSDAGRWYHGVVKGALLAVLTDVSGRSGLTVAAALRAVPTPVTTTSPARPAE